MTPVRAYVVLPLLEGPATQIHVYLVESARDAVRAHGRPGEWLVIPADVWSASEVVVAEGRLEACS